jgi:hypothetical protein
VLSIRLSIRLAASSKLEEQTMIENLTVTQLLAAFVGLYLMAAGIGLLRERDS